MKLATLIVFTFAVAAGQEFEVASIKPSPPPEGPRIRVDMDGGPGTSDPTTFSCRNCSLSMLVMKAYDLKYYQVEGLGSRSSELYEIAAKVPGETTRAQFRVMLQNLLADRFKMTLHRDKKQMQAYDLIIGRNGTKLRKSITDPVSKENALPSAGAPQKITLDRDGFPTLPPGRDGMVSIRGRARMQGLSETMEQLADKISNQLDAPVIDSTKLQGKYDFSLYWAAESTEPDNSGPNIFSAIQSQLGLQLKRKKTPVTIIVIDHIDSAPSGN